MLSRDRQARMELDRRVRMIDWTPRACAYGSAERYRVALWMMGTDLVAGEMRRLYPIPGQRDTMTQWVMSRVCEKITGIPVDSKGSQWNWHGLWDPLEPTSFCAWVRRVSIPLAQWNAKRVLKRRDIDATTLETEEGDNPRMEAALGRANPMRAHLFDRYPGLSVPRPYGPLRDTLTRMLREQDAGTMLAWLRDRGWWHHSLDPLEPGEQAALLLTPIPDGLAPLMEGADLDLRDADRLTGLYWPTQLNRPRRTPAGLNREITRVGLVNHVDEYEVICRLGTQAARLACD